jgi:hypothetical protein
MNRKIFYSLFQGIVSLFICVSCVDNRYDLTKEISLDINTGGSAFSIPIGNTDSIMLGDLIDESGVLTIDETGQYAITKSDHIDQTDVQIDPVLMNDIEVDLHSLELDFISGLLDRMNLPSGIEVTIPELTAPVFQTGSFRMNAEVQDELISIQTVELDQEKSTVCRFTIKLEGMPEGIGNMTLDDFRVIMPDFLKFSEDDQMVNGVLLLDGVEFSPYEGFSREFSVTGADFRKMNNGQGLKMQQINGENRLILNSTVTMVGKLKIGQTTIDISELEGIVLIPELSVPSIEVHKFTGLVDPEIDPVEESVAFDLDEDLDFLKKDDIILEVHNPQIRLVIGNTIGIPVDLNVSMYAKNRQGTVIEGSMVEGVTLKVKAAESDGVVTETNFLISRQGTEAEGYETVRIENLSNLMKVVPDSIIFEMTAEANQEQTHHIDLEKALQITGSYDMMVPLQFDTLHINYRDTINGLIDDLSDISDKLKSSEMQLLLTAESTVPVELTLEVVPLDAGKKEINGISATVSGTIAGGNGTEVTKTPLTVNLSSKEGKLPDLDALALRITAVTGANSGGDVPLNANQFLRFTGMSLKTEGGVDLDLNE